MSPELPSGIYFPVFSCVTWGWFPLFLGFLSSSYSSPYSSSYSSSYSLNREIKRTDPTPREKRRFWHLSQEARRWWGKRKEYCWESKKEEDAGIIIMMPQEVSERKIKGKKRRSQDIRKENTLSEDGLFFSFFILLFVASSLLSFSLFSGVILEVNRKIGNKIMTTFIIIIFFFWVKETMRMMIHQTISWQ